MYDMNFLEQPLIRLSNVALNKMEDPSNGPAAKLTTLPTSYSFLVKMINLEKFELVHWTFEINSR